MSLIVGCIVVVGCVLGGFVISGGHIHALIHPAEVLTIGGATVGGMIIMSPTKVLKDLVKAMIACLKGSPFNAQMYRDLFKLTYNLLRVARRDGLLALEAHVSNPHESKIFNAFPSISHNHHLMEFIGGGLAPIIDNVTTPDQVKELLEAELHVMHDEHHKPIDVLSKAADALPGFGIVAAVLGIVITMGAINGPVEEIGHKVGAALVGTFLGILASYGFIGPLAARMDSAACAEHDFFKTTVVLILSFADDCAPKVAIEKARRGLSSELRPNREELDKLFKEAEAM